MNLTWTYNQIPEFDTLSSEERKVAWKAISSELKDHPKVKTATTIGTGLMFFLTMLGLTSAYEVLGWNRIITGACFGGLGGAVFSSIQISSMRKHMQSYIDHYFKELERK